MPYYLIVLVGSIALVTQYVFATEAAGWSKWLVTGLLLLCLASGFHALNFGFAGLLLQVGLSFFIVFYLICAKARRGL